MFICLSTLSPCPMLQLRFLFLFCSEPLQGAGSIKTSSGSQVQCMVPPARYPDTNTPPSARWCPSSTEVPSHAHSAGHQCNACLIPVPAPVKTWVPAVDFSPADTRSQGRGGGGSMWELLFTQRACVQGRPVSKEQHAPASQMADVHAKHPALRPSPLCTCKPSGSPVHVDLEIRDWGLWVHGACSCQHTHACSTWSAHTLKNLSHPVSISFSKFLLGCRSWTPVHARATPHAVSECS
jgi:hypothetical protein